MDSFSSDSLGKIKVIFLGSSGVGKTSVISKFVDQSFIEAQIPTIGIDFIGKTIFVDGRPIRIQIWDTAGQERFHSLIPSYIRQAKGAIVMYDVTNRESFFEVRKWVFDIRTKSEQNMAVVVVGNKQDKEKREVSQLEGEQLSQELGVPFCETSARTGLNIGHLFESVARQVQCSTRAEEPHKETILLEATPHSGDDHSKSCSC